MAGAGWPGKAAPPSDDSLPLRDGLAAGAAFAVPVSRASFPTPQPNQVSEQQEQDWAEQENLQNVLGGGTGDEAPARRQQVPLHPGWAAARPSCRPSGDERRISGLAFRHPTPPLCSSLAKFGTRGCLGAQDRRHRPSGAARLPIPRRSADRTGWRYGFL